MITSNYMKKIKTSCNNYQTPKYTDHIFYNIPIIPIYYLFIYLRLFIAFLYMSKMLECIHVMKKLITTIL